MREIELIVLHCLATPDDSPSRFTLSDVDRWHKLREFRRDPKWVARFNPEHPHVGYHYIIFRDGRVEAGRNEEERGEHVSGHNSRSLGIALEGTRRFTEAQWRALSFLLEQKRADYPEARVVGHRELDPRKECPGFEVAAYLAADCVPALAWVYQKEEKKQHG